jgi:hypothetical protein
MEEIKSVKERYIAFIDLLGMKNAIYNDTRNEHLNNLHTIYKSWLRAKHNCCEFEDIKIKIFSDNIAVVAERNNLEELLQYIAWMAEHFLQCGYKVRGGIVKGEVYADDVLIWGKGLVEAYRLENEVAKYPRVIIDRNIIFDISEHTRDKIIEAKDKDENGDEIYFIDYLNWFGSTHERYIKTIQEAIEYLEIENSTIESVIEKNNWLLNYLKESKHFHERKIKEKNDEIHRIIL